jgi:hypothetical protein
MDQALFFPFIVGIIGLFITLLSIIVKDDTLNDKIQRNILFLIILGSLMIFLSYFMSEMNFFSLNALSLTILVIAVIQGVFPVIIMKAEKQRVMVGWTLTIISIFLVAVCIAAIIAGWI